VDIQGAIEPLMTFPSFRAGKNNTHRPARPGFAEASTPRTTASNAASLG
jgi:hypothetical protein